MNDQNAEVEPVTLNDVWGLDTWNRPRTPEELQSFITTRHNNLPNDVEIS